MSGTGWYHSHTNLQRAQGLFGMNIVRQAPEDEPHSRLYDYDLTEHLIIIQEWFHGVILLLIETSNLEYEHLLKKLLVDI